MHFGLDIATDQAWSDVRMIVRVARAAELAGWDGIFLWDILLAEENAASPVADPWIALAAVASATERIRLGILVTPLPRRRPWIVAKQAATLDQLSGGRLILGVGLGWQSDDFTRFGEVFDAPVRARRLDEGLRIVRALWSGDPVHHAGDDYRLSGPVMLPRPVQDPLPIWVAAGWPRRAPLARTVEADGLALMTLNQSTQEILTPAEVAAAVTEARRVRAAAHVPEDRSFDVAVNFYLDQPLDVAAMAAAGATWCIGLNPLTVAEQLEAVRRGPPAAV